jgi:anti-anti-sigma regulatory factor
MTDVDTTAADMLEELDGELEAAGIELVFAEMKDAVRQKIKGYGLDWQRDRKAFYPTVGSAVHAFGARDFVDAEDVPTTPPDGT